MRVLLFGLVTAFAVSGVANAACNTPPSGSGPVLTAGTTQLAWCWPAVTGGSGGITYNIESKTNGGSWVPEGSSSQPEWTSTRNIGESVVIRYYACDTAECTSYSPESQHVRVLEDFDFNQDGIVGGPDFLAWRSFLDNTTLMWFGEIFGADVINGIYVK